MSQLFILGASDPEMTEIENILSQNGLEHRPATVDGKRCHPGNAYKADAIEVPENVDLVLIECEPVGAQNFVRIDHHRPGDPGYGLTASEFWEASSLGQLYSFLGLSNPSQDDLILAAMDHCPAAAIRGECPGVSAQEVLNRKILEIAQGTNHDAWEVREKVSLYSSMIESAPEISIGGQSLRDLRSDYLGEGYSVNLLAAQTAALAGSYTVLLKHRDAVGKPEKWSISGHATPELIEAFKDEWAPAQGLTGIYGVPNRGYAGGYLPEKAYCSNGCELSEEEIRWNAGLPSTDTLGVYCDRCDNAPCADSMKVGWRGWTEPSEQQINQFMSSHRKGWN